MIRDSSFVRSLSKVRSSNDHLDFAIPDSVASSNNNPLLDLSDVRAFTKQLLCQSLDREHNAFVRRRLNAQVTVPRLLNSRFFALQAAELRHTLLTDVQSEMRRAALDAEFTALLRAGFDAERMVVHRRKGYDRVETTEQERKVIQQRDPSLS